MVATPQRAAHIVRGCVRSYDEPRPRYPDVLRPALHSALLYQTPATWYRGNPHQVAEARRRKLARARHRRKQFNLGIRQKTFPFSASESAPNN